jgi:HlyD family secretion protein
VWLKTVIIVLVIALVVGIGYARFGESLIETVSAMVEKDESATASVPIAPPPPRPGPGAGGQSEGLSVSALGRLEPQDGILRVAGPSDMVVVVETLLVDEGDRVKAGDLIATLDTGTVIQAKIERIKAELIHARREYARSQELNRDKVLPDSERDRWESQVIVLEAEQRQAEAELARASVHAPIDGQVLAVHTWPGERVGEKGIVELARTHRMYAIAEVYETDIRRVHRGQQAYITSPAFEEPLGGKVEFVRLKVAKHDSIGTDPAARKDARVVEVEIRLDDSRIAAGLTNLQVQVLIVPDEESD